MSSDQIKRRDITRPMLAPFEINTILGDVQAAQHPDVWAGSIGGSGYAAKPETEDNWPIWIKLTRDLPEFGVFYAKTGWGSERLHASGVDELTSVNLSYDLFLTTPSGGVTDASISAYIIGTHQPHRVLFDDTNGVPMFGDKVGVLPGTYKVSLDYEGMLAVSDGDTDTGTVWVIRDATTGNSGTLVLVQLTEALHPGQAASANRILQVDGVWSVGPSCIVQDIEHRSFGLIGDLLWATRTGTTSDGMVVYEAVGENGLEQYGTTADDVSCGGTGTFTVKHGGLTKDVTDQSLSISDKAAAAYLSARKALVDAGTCDHESSGPEVQACTQPGFSRKIFAGETAKLRYSTANRRWIAIPQPELLFAYARLQSDMCSTGTVLGDITEFVGFCTPPTLPNNQSLRNTHNHKAKALDSVYVQFDGVSEWKVIDVILKDEHVPTDFYWDDAACKFVIEWQNTALEECEDPDDPLDLPIGEEITVLTGIYHDLGSGANCDTAYPKYRTIKALCPGTEYTDTVPITEWDQSAFLIDVYESYPVIMGCWMTVNVPACGRSSDCDTLMEPDPCTSGSGSGG